MAHKSRMASPRSLDWILVPRVPWKPPERDSSLINQDQLVIGFGGNAGLVISDSANVSNGTGIIGVKAASTGDVVVSGSGSTWLNSDLYLGTSNGSTNGGHGRLEMNKGGFVRVGNDSTAHGGNTLVVSDSATRGNLVLRNNSDLLNQGDAVVGLGSGRNGRIALDGNGTTVTNTGDLFVGLLGSGSLSVSDGASVSTSMESSVEQREPAAT